MELVTEGSLEDLIIRETRLSKQKVSYLATHAMISQRFLGEYDGSLVTLDVCSALMVWFPIL